MKKIIIFLLLIMPVSAKHIHNERYYQNIWCREHQGISEYVLPDSTRVDCLTKEYAVEFDFASKWAESTGQSLYYAKMTDKKPAIVLIMENQGDEKYYKRARLLADNYNISLFQMKSENNNYQPTDIISELIAMFKNWLKIFLIDLIDKI